MKKLKKKISKKLKKTKKIKNPIWNEFDESDKKEKILNNLLNEDVILYIFKEPKIMLKQVFKRSPANLTGINIMEF